LLSELAGRRNEAILVSRSNQRVAKLPYNGVQLTHASFAKLNASCRQSLCRARTSHSAWTDRAFFHQCSWTDWLQDAVVSPRCLVPAISAARISRL